jgi:hypothetical protein
MVRSNLKYNIMENHNYQLPEKTERIIIEEIIVDRVENVENEMSIVGKIMPDTVIVSKLRLPARANLRNSYPFHYIY